MKWFYEGDAERQEIDLNIPRPKTPHKDNLFFFTASIKAYACWTKIKAIKFLYFNYITTA